MAVGIVILRLFFRMRQLAQEVAGNLGQSGARPS